MKDKEEVRAIDYQLIGLIITLITTIIAIILTYNEKLQAQNRKTLFNNKIFLILSYFNRILILLIAFLFLYINYKLYNISKQKHEDLKSYQLQIVASYLTIIAGIIAIYVVSLSTSDNGIVDVENPNI